MEEKLKSITSRTHWSLLLKAGVFALAWNVLPFWVFVICVCIAHVVPFFEPRHMAFPLVLSLVFGAYAPHSVVATLFLGMAYFLIRGVKELVFIDRGAAYEAITFLFFLGSSLLFFSYAQNAEKLSSFIIAACIAFGAWFLMRDLISHGRSDGDHVREHESERIWLICSVLAILVWQVFVATMFLPINVFLQSALIILSGAVFVSALRDYATGRLTQRMIVLYGGLWFVGVIALLMFASWKV